MRYCLPLLAIGLMLVTSLGFVSSVHAQSCGGTGYICKYGCSQACFCNGVQQVSDTQCLIQASGCAFQTIDQGCAQRNIGCGSAPNECSIIPQQVGCDFYSGTCYNPGSGGGGGGSFCGNNSCETGETCSNCLQDCAGSCGWGACGDASCPDVGCAVQLRRRDPSGNCVCDFAGCGAPSCVPNCTNRCGQPNGCGGTCSAVDAGAPGSTTLSQPVDGGNVTITPSGQVTLKWHSASKADEYEMQLFTRSGGCGIGWSICTNIAATSYAFTPPETAGNRYTVRLRPVNRTCSYEVDGWTQADFTIMAKISGNFYEDPQGQAALLGGICNLAGATGNGTPGIGASIGAEADGLTYSGNISPQDKAGTTFGYSVLVPWWPASQFPNNIVTLDPGVDSTGMPYALTCPKGGLYAGIAAPQSPVNFYLTPLNLANAGWWQVQGGHVYAGQVSGQALLTQVPDQTCKADPQEVCRPFMLRQDADNTPDSAGIALTGGGTVDTSAASGIQMGWLTDRQPTNMTARGTQLRRTHENYTYFYRQYSLGFNPSNDFAGLELDAPKPTQPPLNARAYYAAGASLIIQQPWTVRADEQMVVFVAGDLIIDDPRDVQQLITVEEGGFLAFIVQGDILIRPDVGNDDLDDATPNIEGVFVTDGQLHVESRGATQGGDDRFVGAGTFVGWSGVVLDRDFDDGDGRKAENNTRPVELFIYRPDFVNNTPERFKSPHYIWQETN